MGWISVEQQGIGFIQQIECDKLPQQDWRKLLRNVVSGICSVYERK